uniref:Chitin-binding type-1 domain-containing protein n=1 Tax=Solanum lycopersicum TaxID=4081 RepID=A0A3Q7FU94_SOLLC
MMMRITIILAFELLVFTMGSDFDVRKNETLEGIDEPYPSGRCGWQAGGRKCPPKLCCSRHGWCGTERGCCDPDFCQSQCSGTPMPPYIAPFLTARQQPARGMRGIRSFFLNADIVWWIYYYY